MDISIKLDHPQATFSNGDTIFGNVIIYCPTNSTTTMSNITASLVGESVLMLNDKGGLLMDWKQQEKHRVGTLDGLTATTVGLVRIGWTDHYFSVCK
jgi:hypothetical protein